MVNMWATADFKTKRFVRAICDHFVYLDVVAVAITKLAKCAQRTGCFLCWIFGKTDFQIFADLIVYDCLYLVQLFTGYFFWMTKVKTKTFFGDITAVLYNMGAQHVTERLVHQVRCGVVFLVLQ